MPVGLMARGRRSYWNGKARWRSGNYSARPGSAGWAVLSPEIGSDPGGFQRFSNRVVLKGAVQRPGVYGY